MEDYRAVALDIDGTLTLGSSWQRLTEGMGADFKKHIRLYEQMNSGELTESEAASALLQHWQQAPHSDQQSIMKILAQFQLTNGAKELCKRLVERDKKVCLITSSVIQYAGLVASHLGIANYYANASLEFTPKGKLANFVYHHDQNALKAEQLKKFLDYNHINLDECVVVGDGNNDEAMFRMTGRGVLYDHGQTDVSEHCIASAKYSVHRLPELMPLLKLI